LIFLLDFSIDINLHNVCDSSCAGNLRVLGADVCLADYLHLNTITISRHSHGFRPATDQRCQDQECSQVRCSYPKYQREGHSTRFCVQAWGNTFRYPSSPGYQLLKLVSHGPRRNKRPVRPLLECRISLLIHSLNSFVVVSILNDRKQTPVVKRTLNPVYNPKDATFDFPIYLSLADKIGVIEIVVWDKDLLKKEYLGEVSLPLDDWFVDKKDKDYCFDQPGNEVGSILSCDPYLRVLIAIISRPWLDSLQHCHFW